MDTLKSLWPNNFRLSTTWQLALSPQLAKPTINECLPHLISLYTHCSDEAKQALEVFATPFCAEEVSQLRKELDHISKLSEKYIARRQVILRELTEIVAEVLETGISTVRMKIMVDVREYLTKADEVMGLVETSSTEHLQLLGEKLKVSPRADEGNGRNVISKMKSRGRDSTKPLYNA